MSAMDFTVDTTFLLETTVGILGNFSLLCHNIFLFFSGGKLRSKDLIISHLAIGNSMVLLPKVSPRTLTLFGYTNFLNDFGCKFLAYIHRVGRGVSIGSSCLLSVFQTITISRGNPKWAELKAKLPVYVGVSILLCWNLHVQLNVIYLIFVTVEWRNSSLTKAKQSGFCSFVCLDKTTGSLYAALLAFPDAVCLALMLCSSGSMVLLLYRHKKRVQHIHRSVSPRSSPEIRATRTVLVLVSTFVSFYTLSITFNVFVNISSHPTHLLLDITGICSAFYPAVSPFVLMKYEGGVSSLTNAWRRKTKATQVVRNT